MQLSRDFRLEEFVCPCGCGGEIRVTARLIAALQDLRDLVKQPIVVSKGGGFRCIKFNATLPNASRRSQHLIGQAADVWVNHLADRHAYKMKSWELAKYAEKVEAFRNGGIGLYEGWLHVDVRLTGPARWDRRNKVEF